MTHRYYKSYAGLILGSDPEYADCKDAVTGNPDKYKYTTTDYPCAKPRELELFSTLNIDSNISDCYKRLLEHKITHASRHEKRKLSDVGLMLRIPGFIDRAGESTGYNVNKDCTITVTTVSSATGLLIKQQIMSRGAFDSKYKIDPTYYAATTPAPAPAPAPTPGDDITGAIEDMIENITKPPYIYIVAAGGVVGALVLFRVIR